MRLDTRRLFVNRVLAATSAAAIAGLSRPAFADPAAPTFSLKGLPDVLSGGSEFSSDRSSVTTDLGVFGRGTNKDKSGRLNKCTENGGKKGCISTFDEPDAESYIPPWTYQPGYSTQAISANDARRQALREQAGLEANGGVAPPPKPQKSKEDAYEELKAAIVANEGKIVEEGECTASTLTYYVRMCTHPCWPDVEQVTATCVPNSPLRARLEARPMMWSSLSASTLRSWVTARQPGRVVTTSGSETGSRTFGRRSQPRAGNQWGGSWRASEGVCSFSGSRGTVQIQMPQRAHRHSRPSSTLAVSTEHDPSAQ